MQMTLNLTAGIALQLQDIGLRINADIELLASRSLGIDEAAIAVLPLLGISLVLLLQDLEVISDVTLGSQGTVSSVLGSGQRGEGAQDIRGASCA